MAIHRTIDFSRRRALAVGNDVLAKRIENDDMIYYNIFDYEHGDTSKHASIAHATISIALETAAKLSATKYPITKTEGTVLYIDGQKACDLMDVDFEKVQITADGRFVIIQTHKCYIVVINDSDKNRRIIKTQSVDKWIR